MNVTANPYAPPEVESLAEVTLPPDTEFLFNDKCLAVADQVALPRLCVITAAPVPKQFAKTAILWWIPTLIQMPLFISGVILALISLAFTDMAIKNAATPGTGPSARQIFNEWSFLSFVSVVAVGFAGLLVLSFVFGRRIQIHWFVSQREIQRYRRRQLVWTLVWLTAGVIFVGNSQSIFGQFIGEHLAFLAIFVAIRVTSWIRGPRPLRIIGRFNGLFLVTGLSDGFLEALQSLMQHSAETQSRAVINSPNSDTANRHI